jgi:hypothetical protein
MRRREAGPSPWVLQTFMGHLPGLPFKEEDHEVILGYAEAGVEEVAGTISRRAAHESKCLNMLVLEGAGWLQTQGEKLGALRVALHPSAWLAECTALASTCEHAGLDTHQNLRHGGAVEAVRKYDVPLSLESLPTDSDIPDLEEDDANVHLVEWQTFAGPEIVEEGFMRDAERREDASQL